MVNRFQKMQWATWIIRALRENRIQLYYQSIVPLGALGALQSSGDRYELLCRIRDVDGAMLLPCEFIHAAERYKLVTDIDRRVVSMALNMLSQIYAGDSLPEQRLESAAINISGASFGDKDFLNFVQSQLERSQLDPQCICFEITESAAITNITQAINFIATLQKMGCSFALDDFGSGLSSFSYLKNFPVNYLKIDGAFIQAIDSDTVSKEIVLAINHVAHQLGLKTVAECVDRPGLLQQLTEMGVDYAQGNFLSQPRPLADLLKNEHQPAKTEITPIPMTLDA